MLDLVSNFSSKNDGKFNDNLLIELRQRDDMVVYIDDACKAIANLLPKYVKYKGYYFNDNRKKMLERDEAKDAKEAGKNETRIHINDTYAKEAIFEFDCTFNGQTVTQSFALWIPLLIDNCHLYIRGNKYSAPIQIIDAITFTKKNVLVLKTITRAVKFTRMKITLTDIYGKTFNTYKLHIFVNKKSISVLIYYFAYFGFYKTLEYFGADQFIKLYTGSISENVPTDKYIFKFGQVFLGVDKVAFDQNSVLRMFVGSIIDAAKRTTDEDYIRNPIRWTMLLGETISIPKALEKGDALLQTFKATMDYRTPVIIKQLTGVDRCDMFSVVRWIFVDYVKLCSKDDGLQNKRVRLNEYLITPFIRTFIDKVYRFMNTPEKLKTMNGLLDVFKIKSSLILNAIIGKISPQVTGLNIAKYSSETNDCSLVNVLLNVTKSGPGSPTEKSKRLGMSHRQISVDYLGNLNLMAGLSAGDPGLSRYLNPMCNSFDLEKKIFVVDPKLIRR